MNTTVYPARSQIGSVHSPTIHQNISSQSMQISALPVNVNVITSFLHIHLKDQFEKLKYSQSDFIRYRQIIQHAELILVDGSAKHEHLLNLLKKVWMETIIQTCLKDFEEEYMNGGQNKLKDLKKNVAERYLFQLCKLRQFVQSGRRNFEGKQTEKQVNLSAIFTLSDQNLYHVLQRKNMIFFDKDSRIKLDYPKSLQSFQTYQYDLLKSFKAKSLNYDIFLNKDYIFDDIRFILNQAVKEWQNYQNDMRVLFEGKLQTNLKVKKQSSGGFNVIGIRRILTKWVEFLLQNDKELASSSRFYYFIMKKPLVYDNFYMNDKNSRIPPCQQKICHLLLQLLICSVYHGEKNINKQFGLFIYDLLRGKMSVQTIQQMQILLNRLKNPPTGLINKIQVFRMKNRLKTHNRDILINFRYGKILAAEIQIYLEPPGSVEQKKRHKKMYQYKHFIYELSRSIFGPTIELMNIYEDNYRSSEIRMYSTGIVSLRDTKKFQGIKFTDKECYANHKLIHIVSQLNTKKQLCRSCFQQLSNYHHCFQCTVSFCQNCVNNIKYRKKTLFEKNDTSQLKRIHKLQQLFNQQGLILVIFHLSYSPASNLMLKYISYLLKLKEYDLSVHVVDILQDPKIYFYIQKYLSIDRFPAFCLFNDSDLRKSIIGSSLYKIVDLIDLLQTQTPSKKCPLDHELIKKKPASYVFWTCNQCYKSRNSNKNQKSDEQIFFCTECLYCCCSNCAFCKNQIDNFQDKNGVSYLSTALVPEKTIQCNQGHKMIIHHTNPLKSIEFKCFKCSKQFFFIGEVGMYSCQKCKVYKCNFCSETGFSNLSNQKQYANHAVEAYALDYPLCLGCSRPYKFSQHKFSKQWMCRNCRNPFNKTNHISCQKCNIHYCGNCQNKIKSKEQVSVMTTQCSCKQGTLKPKPLKLNNHQTFMCMICFNRFYYNQPHHECQICRFNYCNSCLQTLKTKVKINIVSQDLQNKTTITQYIFQLPLTTSIKHLRQSLKSNGIIPNQCTGKFSLVNRKLIEVQKQQDIRIQNLQPNFEIFYLKTMTLSSHLINIFFQKMDNNMRNKPMGYAPKYVIKESLNEQQNDKQNKINQNQGNSQLIEFAESQNQQDLYY